jgi:diguanylate cyclase (GGDEF)-like protein
MASGLIFFVFALIDIYLINVNGLSYNLTQKGLLVFLLANFLIVTTQFGEAYKKTKILSQELEQEVARQTAELTKLSRTDPLTGVDNRRWFLEQGEREIKVHNRGGRPLSLMMLDIDYFKKVNDRYGHSCGDKALIFMTELCHDELRETDILGRLGGEEFAIMLLDTDCRAAAVKADFIRRKLEESTLECPDGIPPMTVSIGVVSINTEESIRRALERADTLLYRAKEKGRNRVESEKRAD